MVSELKDTKDHQAFLLHMIRANILQTKAGRETKFTPVETLLCKNRFEVRNMEYDMLITGPFPNRQHPAMLQLKPLPKISPGTRPRSNAGTKNRKTKEI